MFNYLSTGCFPECVKAVNTSGFVPWMGLELCLTHGGGRVNICRVRNRLAGGVGEKRSSKETTVNTERAQNFEEHVQQSEEAKGRKRMTKVQTCTTGVRNTNM